MSSFLGRQFYRSTLYYPGITKKDLQENFIRKWLRQTDKNKNAVEVWMREWKRVNRQLAIDQLFNSVPAFIQYLKSLI